MKYPNRFLLIVFGCCLLSACGPPSATIKKTRLVKVAPIADQYTESLVRKICEEEYKSAYDDALSRASAATRERNTRTQMDCRERWNGQMQCTERSYSVGGGFWGGVTQGLNNHTSAKNATRGIKTNCYRRYGFDVETIAVHNPAYARYQIEKAEKVERESTLQFLSEKGGNYEPTDVDAPLESGTPLTWDQFSSLKDRDRKERVFELVSDQLVSRPLHYAYGVFSDPVNPSTGKNVPSLFWFSHDRLGICSATGQEKTGPFDNNLSCALEWECSEVGKPVSVSGCEARGGDGFVEEIVVDIKEMVFSNGEKISFKAIHFQ